MIIEFAQRAIELSGQVRVSPKMKVALVAPVLAPLICLGADPLLNMSEGTTWNYEMVQERPSEGFDLTEPNEQEQIAVTYRVGGTQKIDNQDLGRLEIYRGNALESVDLIRANEQGVICAARLDANNNVAKFTPPQQIVKRPFETGASWNFDGTIGETKVSQRYEIAGEEDVDVPAGKFHAWRIHCEQTSPSTATIDRWFAPGTGFVKVETVLKGLSGAMLQKTSLKLKEPPKVTAVAAHRETESHSKELTAGVSSEPNGEFKIEFKSDAPAIYVRWRGQALPKKAEIRAAFIAENVVDISADYEVDEAKAVAPKTNSSGTFTLSKPETGWMPGNYRVEFYVGDNLAQTVKFKISK